MSVDEALLNCAYKVAAQVIPAAITSFKGYGGGSAPGGVCGALYAVQQKFPQQRAQLEVSFLEHVGASTCSEIMASGVKCSECVRVALQLAVSSEK